MMSEHIYWYGPQPIFTAARVKVVCLHLMTENWNQLHQATHFSLAPILLASLQMAFATRSWESRNCDLRRPGCYKNTTLCLQTEVLLVKRLNHQMQLWLVKTIIKTCRLLLKGYVQIVESKQTFMYMYTCTSACLYVRMYACMDGWMGGWMDGWTYACISVCLYVCVCVCICLCVCVCLYVYMSIYLHVYTSICLYVYTSIRLYVYVYV